MTQTAEPPPAPASEYVIIRALEDGVTVSFQDMSQGVKATALAERLQRGETLVLFLDPRVTGYKIKGNVEILSAHGRLRGTGATLVETGRG
ncbi:MAG: trp RNA-binding attenuation protein MtrB [bacterium]